MKRRDAIELLACTSASTLALPTRQAAQQPSALDAAGQLRPLHLAEQALTTDYQGRALALHFPAMR